MAGYNGSGTFTKSIDWVDDQANSIPIRADRHDTVDNEFISGFNTAWTRDGQAPATANIPMATFKFTNVGIGSARNEYLTLGQFQDQSGIRFVSTGSANAYVLTPAPAITAYVAGNTFIFNANFTNTAAATIDVSGVGAKSIFFSGAALSGNEILSGQEVEITYDGTQFNIMSPINVHATYSQAVLFNQVFS